MPPRSKFVWNAKAGRYTIGGRFVKQSEIRKALDASLAATSRTMANLSARLQKGNITLIEWERLMREAVKDAHLFSAALAKGGWAQMTQADYGRVGQMVRMQYTYLNRFAADIESGMNLDGRFKARTEMYMEAGRTTYYNMYDQVQKKLGKTEERNILHSAEHCVQCIEQTGLGWVPIGELVQIGNRLCLTRCKCDKEYR
jgi:hypothetical protein